VARAGAGKNGGDRWKQRQRRGQTTINQKAAVIAAETPIVAVAATMATEMAAADMAAAAVPTMAEAATDAVAAAAECNSKPECCLFEEIPYFRFHVDTKMSTYLHSISICVFVNFFLSHKKTKKFHVEGYLFVAQIEIYKYTNKILVIL